MEISDDDILWAIDRGYFDAIRYALHALQSISSLSTHLNYHLDGDESILNMAVESASTAVIEALLDRGFDINATDHGASPLMTAVKCNRLDIAGLLLDRGAKPEVVEVGTGSLDWLLMHRDTDSVTVEFAGRLFAAGADPNAVDSFGTPLLVRLVCRDASIYIVQIVLDAGADVERPSREGTTALTAAVCRGRKSVVELLLERGANPNAATSIGYCPLVEARKHGRYEIEEMLTAAGAVKPDTVQTDLNLAIVWRDADAVRRIVDAGADLSIPNARHYPPLFEAIASFPDIVEVLVDAGADMHASFIRDGEPTDLDALTMAIRCGRASVVDGLIARGVDPNLKSGDEQPLGIAIYYRKPDVVAVLVEGGADIEAVDSAGDTPLHAAIRRGSPEIVEVLIEKGADLDARNSDGVTAAEAIAVATKSTPYWIPSYVAPPDPRPGFAKIAAEHNFSLGPESDPSELSDTSDVQSAYPEPTWRDAEAYAEYERSRRLQDWVSKSDVFSIRDAVRDGADPVPILVEAAGHASVDVIRYLIEEVGVDVDAVSSMPHGTALIAAVDKHYDESTDRQLAAIRLLLEYGADVNKVDDLGQTALYAACGYVYQPDPRILLELLSRGADPNAGACPAVVMAAEAGRADVVRTLVDAGANVNRQDEFGDTAWIIARRKGRSDIADLLLQAGSVEPPEVRLSLHRSIRWNNVDAALGLIAAGVDVNERLDDEFTPLMDCVVFWGDVDIARALLDAGADPYAIINDDLPPELLSQYDNGGVHGLPSDGPEEINQPAIPVGRCRSAFTMAVQYCRHEILRLLIERHYVANAMVRNPCDWVLSTQRSGPDGGFGPVGIAMSDVDRGNWKESRDDVLDTVKLLLEYGANPNTRDHHGNPALFDAAMYGDSEIVELLLSYGANLEMATDEVPSGRMRPLQIAIRAGHYDIANLFLDRGADATYVNTWDQTLLMDMCQNSEKWDTAGFRELLDRLIDVVGDQINVTQSDRTALDMVHHDDMRAYLVSRGFVGGDRKRRRGAR